MSEEKPTWTVWKRKRGSRTPWKQVGFATESDAYNAAQMDGIFDTMNETEYNIVPAGETPAVGPMARGR